MSTLDDEIRRHQRIEVGDLVYLGSDISRGPIGIVLREIIVLDKGEFIRNIEKNISPGSKRDFSKKEYQCCMVGKNGKVINMVFSEEDLIVISKGVKIVNYNDSED